MMGRLPRWATPSSPCVRDSSMVDLTPRRAATTVCTRTSGCSSKSSSSLSVLAKANEVLPVRRLSLSGGFTRNSSSNWANLELLCNILLVDCPAAITSLSTSSRCSAFLRSTSARWASSLAVSSSTLGMVNMRMAWSMTCSSSTGNPALSLSNKARVRLLSLMQ